MCVQKDATLPPMMTTMPLFRKRSSNQPRADFLFRWKLELRTLPAAVARALDWLTVAANNAAYELSDIADLLVVLN